MHVYVIQDKYEGTVGSLWKSEMKREVCLVQSNIEIHMCFSTIYIFVMYCTNLLSSYFRKCDHIKIIQWIFSRSFYHLKRMQ